MNTDSTPSQTSSQRNIARSEDVLGHRPTPGSAGSIPTSGPWKWHHQALLTLRAQLARERESLRETVREPLEPHSQSDADSASDEFDHDLALTQLSHESDALKEIDEALRRIAEGRYGICEFSGRPISADRLKAIPWARYTCDVEKRLESNGGSPPIRLGVPGTVREGAGILFEDTDEEVQPEAADETLGEPRDLPPGAPQGG